MLIAAEIGQFSLAELASELAGNGIEKRIKNGYNYCILALRVSVLPL